MFREFALTVVILLPLVSWSQSNTPSNTESGKDASSTATTQPEDSKHLIAIKTQRPVYPLQAQAEKIQGRVWLQVSINEAGEVEKVDAVEGNRALVDAAVSAMKKWKFMPYIKGGRPVKVNVKIPMDFAFSEKVNDPKSPLIYGQKLPSVISSTPADDPHNASQPIGATPASDTPTPVRISQGDSKALVTYQVAPIYPLEAYKNHIEGNVVLEAIIGTDGNVKTLKVMSGPKALVDSAKGSVYQWRFKPYLLDNRPVEVDTTIEVIFKLH